jgi:hypothetical protein
MKQISENKFFEPIRICKYELCGKEFQPERKDKVFCCRECKNKKRLRKIYFLSKGKEYI